MIRSLISSAALFLTDGSASFAQLRSVNCQTQGPTFYLNQNNRNDYESLMDHNGCRYSYLSSGDNRNPRVIEKIIVMKQPDNGVLRQDGGFSLIYTPQKNYKGKDNFVVYVCGNDRSNSGCARLNYQATIK